MTDMPKSLIGKMLNLGRVPFPSPWAGQGGMFWGNSASDRLSQLQSTTSSGTLFAIIQLLSTGQAKSKWHLYRVQKDGRVRYSKGDKGSDMRQEVLQHQALKLWNRPNPFMTGNDFREIGWQYMELVGEWYWVLDRGSSGKGIPLEMWPVRPDRMEPVPDRDKFLAGWIYSGPNGEKVPLLPSEVVQLRYPHPTDLYRGLSPVQSILADIDVMRYTAEWSRNFFLNSAVPGGIVTFSRRISDEEFEEFTNRWRETHQGVARGHRVGVLEMGATWVPNTYTMRDMEFSVLRRTSGDLIRQAYRIHQAMLGDSTDVNRANAQTAEEVHVSWHEIPRLERQRNVLNEFFLDMFGSTGQGVEFDFEDPAPSSNEEAKDELIAKSQSAAELVKAGWAPDDVLKVVGLPPMSFSGPALPAGNPSQNPADSFTHDDALAASAMLRQGLRGVRSGFSDSDALVLADSIRDAFSTPIIASVNGHQKELV